MILKFLEITESGLEYFARFLAVISALAVAAITTIICASVIMRRVANSPLFYAEELVGLLLAVTLFFALPLVTMRGGHIRVTLLANYLKNKGTAYLGFLGGIVGLGFLGWLIWESIEWMSFAIRLNLKTEAASIPLVPWMSIVPLSLSITAIGMAVQLFAALARFNCEPAPQISGPHDIEKDSAENND